MDLYRIKEFYYEGSSLFVGQRKILWFWMDISGTMGYSYVTCKKKLCGTKFKDIIHEVNCDDTV